MARGLPLRVVMIEMLTSDAALALFVGMGLVATTVSILRDTRAQQRASLPTLSVVTDDVADAEVAA